MGGTSGRSASDDKRAHSRSLKPQVSPAQKRLSAAVQPAAPNIETTKVRRTESFIELPGLRRAPPYNDRSRAVTVWCVVVPLPEQATDHWRRFERHATNRPAWPFASVKSTGLVGRSVWE